MREELQAKRGYEKPPFQLPDYITATGISKLRGADQDIQDGKSLKSKTRRSKHEVGVRCP